MVDKVKPLKMEDSTSGTEINFGPKETDPTEDYLATKGLALENSDNTTIHGDSGEMKFKDSIVTIEATLQEAIEKINRKDVDLSSLIDGYVLTWNTAGVKFVLLPTGGGGSGVTPPFTFARSGNNPVGSYLKTGDVVSSNTGQPISGTNKIIAVAVTNSSTVGSITRVQIQERTAISTFVDVTGAFVDLPSGQYKATNSGLTITFGADKEMSIYIKSGSSLQNPVVVVYLIPA